MNLYAIIAEFSIVVCASYGATRLVKKYATRLNLLDLPTQRSLHTLPTPRGGGLGIPLFGLLGIVGTSLPAWVYYLFLSSGLVALVGLIDDLKGLSPKLRLSVHLCSGVIFLAGLELPPNFEYSFIEMWKCPFALVFIVWMLNLYNFMDGIDGLAGVQAVTASASLFLLTEFKGAESYSGIYLTLGAAGIGFLLLNWYPSKIFMGDVASGFLGFVFGSLAVRAAYMNEMPISVFLILFSYFITDTGITLLRRLIRGAQIFQAHREHAYQKLVQRGYKHSQVASAIAIYNIVWLAPLAFATIYFQDFGPIFLVTAYLPTIIFCVRIGAGEP